MCLELSQADLKAIGRSRQIEPRIVGSRELFQQVFLSDQGVAPAAASLAPAELAVLHLLNCLREAVDLEFFKRLYPAAVSTNLYGSYTERFKGLFQEVKTKLIQRGLLLFGALPDTLVKSCSLLERRRFRFPEAFGPLLPAPFQARQLDPAITGNYRGEVLRDKLAALPREAGATGKRDQGKAGGWCLENGELRLGAGSSRFRVNHLEAWQRAQFEAAVGYTSRAQPEALMPVPLLLYALSRLREAEWVAPDELLPLWKVALPGAKAPEPQIVCEAGYEWGCVEKIEVGGTMLYRLPKRPDGEASLAPEGYLQTGDPQRIGIRLASVPLAAMQHLCEVSRLELAEGELWAAPDLLKLSHAGGETLAEPLLFWLREHHPAFRTTMEQIEQRRGKLLVHENLLVARVKDLALKATLERQFGGPGKLVGLSSEFVAFPTGLLPELQAALKKSGHVVRRIESGEPTAEAMEDPEDE